MTTFLDFLDRECCPCCGQPEENGWCYTCQPLDDGRAETDRSPSRGFRGPETRPIGPDQ